LCILLFLTFLIPAQADSYEWSTPTTLISNIDSYYDLASDSQKNWHIVYQTIELGNPNRHKIHYTNSTGIDLVLDSGSTISDENGMLSGTSLFDPRISIDSSDGVHITYIEDTFSGTSALKYTKKTQGSWSTPTTLRSNIDSYYDLASDSQKNWHIVYQTIELGNPNRHKIHYTNSTGIDLVLDSGSTISDENGMLSGTSLFDPRISIDSSDGVHITYIEDTFSGTSALKYTKKTQGSWSTPTTLRSNIDSYYDLASDSQKNWHIVYQTIELGNPNRHKIHYTNSTGIDLVLDSGSTISDENGMLSGTSLFDPRISIDSSDGVHITYIEDTFSGTSALKYTKKDAPPVPVILVWGWNGCAENWDLIKSWLETDGHTVTILDYDDSQYATVGANTLSSCVMDFNSQGYPKVDIIAHSFGGIASRTYIEEMGGDQKVRNLIMIATPNHGTRLADYLTGTLPNDPYENSLVDIFFALYRHMHKARDWDSSINLRTIDNPRLFFLNNQFRYNSNIKTHYYTVAGTGHYPKKVTSHEKFNPGLDDGVTTADSVMLPGIPIYYINLDHSSLVNPFRVLDFDSDPIVNGQIQRSKAEITLDLYSNIIKPILQGTPPNPSLYPKPSEVDPDDHQTLPDLADSIKVQISNGQTVQGNFNIPSNLRGGTIQITFYHQFSDFVFTITSPSGRTISPDVAQDDPFIEFIKDENYWYYTLNHPESGDWEYEITAIDVPEEGEDITIYINEIPLSSPPPVVSLLFHPGWNFISIPKSLSDGNNTAVIFDTIEKNGRPIYSYDTENDQWITLEEITLLEPLEAYWIYSTGLAEVTLDYNTAPETPSFKQLYSGWNSIGLGSLYAEQTEKCLSTIDGKWTVLLEFDSGLQMYFPPQVEGANTWDMQPGRGYWVYMNEPGDIVSLIG
jgi:pimeloyl-ACP methyl ester carboxylesterase